MKITKKKFTFIHKLLRFFAHHPFLLLFFVVCLSLWQTLFLYFLLDDWDLFLKVKNLNLNLWNLGPGIFGHGPYRYLHTPFVFLFPFFGLHTQWYFAVGILLYFFAAICVYFLIRQLTANRRLSIAAASLFGSISYIGSYSITHLSNSYQMSLAIIFLSITLFFFILYQQTKKWRYYVLCFLLFLAALEFVYLRVFGSVFLLLGVAIIFFPPKWTKKGFVVFCIQLLPFVAAHYMMNKQVLIDAALTAPIKNANIFESYFSPLKSFLFLFGDPSRLAHFVSLLGSFNNFTIPSVLTQQLFKLLSVFGQYLFIVYLFVFLFPSVFILRAKKQVAVAVGIVFFAMFLYVHWACLQTDRLQVEPIDKFAILQGGMLLLFFLSTVIAFWSKKSMLAKTLLFGIVWAIGEYASYFLHSPTSGFSESESRYFTTSTVGTAVSIGTILYILCSNRKHRYLAIIGIIVAGQVLLINGFLRTLISTSSVPTRLIYESVLKSTKSVPKDPIVFFPYENNRELYRNMQTSYIDSAFAIYFNLPTKPQVFQTFEDLARYIGNRQELLPKIMSYYVKKNHVVNTTEDFQREIRIRKEPVLISLQRTRISGVVSVLHEKVSASTAFQSQDNISVFTSPEITLPIDYKSILPVIVAMRLTVEPDEERMKHFPFVSDQINYRIPELSCKKRGDILAQAVEHTDFLRTAQVSVSSQLSHSPKENLIDGSSQTGWISEGRYRKGDSYEEEVIIDLGATKEIDKLFWVNARREFTPTTYQILVSQDGKKWERVKRIKHAAARQDYELVEETLEAKPARFIAFRIQDTLTGYAPALNEIWVSSIPRSLKYPDEEKIVQCPSCCSVNNESDDQKILSYLDSNASARLSWIDEGHGEYGQEESFRFSIIPDGVTREYHFFIPITGRVLNEIKIDQFPFPVKMGLQEVEVASLTYNESQEFPSKVKYFVNEEEKEN